MVSLIALLFDSEACEAQLGLLRVPTKTTNGQFSSCGLVAMREIRMSGALVENHRRVLEALLPHGSLATALRSVPPEVASEFLDASTLSWVRIGSLEACFEAIAAELGRNPESLQVEVVKRSVTKNMMSIWRLLLRFTSDAELVARMPRVYARAFDGGQAVIRSMDSGRAEFHVEGWPTMPSYARRGLAAGTEAVLEIAGRKGAAVRCVGIVQDQPVFHVTWRIG